MSHKVDQTIIDSTNAVRVVRIYNAKAQGIDATYTAVKNLNSHHTVALKDATYNAAWDALELVTANSAAIGESMDNISSITFARKP